MFDWLSGKKTIICSIGGLLLGIASVIPGVNIPTWAWALTMSAGGISMRQGIKKGQKAAEEVKAALDGK